MTTFALVHGAWHGAWCWERVVPELERRGHTAVTLDLPGEDTTATIATYAGVVVDALAESGDDVVLVGHSLGGITIPLVATQRPVRTLVYLTPSVPVPGVSVVDSMAAEPITGRNMLAEIEQVEGGFLRLQPELWSALFNACSPADMAWAGERLRLQSLTPMVEPFPLAEHPDVPAIAILGTEDRLIDVGMMTPLIRQRLGIEPLVVACDHAPFLSIPGVLADLLIAAC